jgi:hypothetical protein
VLPAWNDGPSDPAPDPFEIQSHGPLNSLSTLHTPGCPGLRKTRFRLAGYALVGRESHPLGSFLKFLGDIDFLLPLEPVFAWRTSFRSLAYFCQLRRARIDCRRGCALTSKEADLRRSLSGSLRRLSGDHGDQPGTRLVSNILSGRMNTRDNVTECMPELLVYPAIYGLWKRRHLPKEAA